MAAACADDDPARPESAAEAVTLITDRTEYVAERRSGESDFGRYGVTVVAEYRNRSVVTVYLGRCGSYSTAPKYHVRAVEAYDGRSGGVAYSPGWACTGASPFAVEPGESRTDTLFLTGPNRRDGQTGEMRGTLEGRFQLVYEARFFPEYTLASEAPMSTRESNAFEVRLTEQP